MAANDHSLSLVHASSQYADVSTNVTNALSKLTAMAWIKPNTLSTNYGLITNWPDGTNTQFIFREVSSSGDIICFIATGTSDDASKNGVTATGVITTGSWQHVAFVFDGTQTGNANRLKVYVNGISQALTFSGTIPTALATTTGRVQVGARDDSTDYFDGLIDEVRLENAAFSAGDIATYSQSDTILSTTLAYWKFNNNLNDSGINSLTLTGHGTPTFSTDVPFANYSGAGGLLLSEI